MNLIHKDLGKLRDSSFIYCLAGGAVRSTILNSPIKDYDYYLLVPDIFANAPETLLIYIENFSNKMGWSSLEKASLDFQENDYSVSRGLVSVFNAKGSDNEAIQIMAMRFGSPKEWVEDFGISTGEFLQLPDGEVWLTNWASIFLQSNCILYTDKHTNRPKYLDRMRTYFPLADYNCVVNREAVKWSRLPHYWDAKGVGV